MILQEIKLEKQTKEHPTAQHFKNLYQFLFKHTKYEKAEQVSRRWVELFPKDVTGLNKMAESLYQQDRQQEAREFCERALEIDPKSSQTYCTMCRFQKDKKVGEQYAKKAVELDPENSQAVSCLGYFYKQKSIKEAQTLYYKALELDQNNSFALNNLGSILQDQNQLEKAEFYYKRSIEANPHNTFPISNLISLLKKQNRKQQALSVRKQSLENNHNNIKLMQEEAINLEEQGKLEESEKMLLRCRETKKDDFVTIKILGRILIIRGKSQEALKYLKEAYQLNSENEQVLVNLIKTYKLLGYIEEKQKFQAIAISKIYKFRDSYWCCTLGDYLKQQGKLSQAEIIFQHGLLIDPNYKFFYSGYSNVLLLQQRYEKCEENLLKALKRFPKNIQLLKLLKYLYHMTKQLKKLEQTYQALFELEPQNPSDYFIIGATLWADKTQKYNTKAQFYLTKASEIDQYGYYGLYSLIVIYQIKISQNKQNEGIVYLLRLRRIILSGKVKQVDLKKWASELKTSTIEQFLRTTENLQQIEQFKAYEQKMSEKQKKQLDKARKTLVNSALDTSNQKEIEEVMLIVKKLQKEFQVQRKQQQILNQKLIKLESEVKNIKVELCWDIKLDAILQSKQNGDIFRNLFWIMSTSVESYRAAQLGILKSGQANIESKAGGFISKVSTILGVAAKLPVIASFCQVLCSVAEQYLELEKQHIITLIVSSTQSLYTPSKLSAAVGEMIIYLASSVEFSKMVVKSRKQDGKWYDRVIEKVDQLGKTVMKKITAFDTNFSSQPINIGMEYCSKILINLIKQKNKDMIGTDGNPLLKAAQCWLNDEMERSKFAESAPTIKVKVTRALISKGKAIGKMDPYCKVHYGCDTYNTGVDKNGDKTPAWKNSIFFLQKRYEPTHIIFRLYTKELIGDDKLIGTAEITDNVQKGTQKALTLEKEGKHRGELYVEFN